MKHQKNIIVILIVVVAAISAYFWYRTPGQKAGDRLFHWERGKTYIYEFDYSTKHKASIFTGVKNIKDEQMAFAVEVHLVGKFVIHSYGYNSKSQKFQLGISFDDLREHEILFSEQNLLPDRKSVDAAFIGQEAFVFVSSNGEIDEIRIDRESPPMFGNIAQTLLGEIQIILGDDESEKWTVSEDNHHGTAICKYRLENADRKEFGVEKRRDEYESFHIAEKKDDKIRQDVDALYEAQISNEGHMNSLKGEEKIEVTDIGVGPIISANTKISLELTETDEFNPDIDLAKRLRKTIKRRIGEISVSEDANRRSFEKRIEGMTVARMTGDLLEYGNSGKMPMHEKWLWRVSGLLKLHPEHCKELKKVFDNEKVNGDGKRLVLDLLVSTGHKEAQKVLLEVLASPTALNDEDYATYLQRVSFLEEPTPEAAKFALEKLETSRNSGLEKDRDIHYGASFALGAVTGRLKKGGQKKLADELNAVLVDQLNSAETAQQKQVYLRSLGNASLKENVPVAAKFAHDEDDGVRRAVLNAIKRTQTQEADKVVLGMVRDDVGIVQSDALRVLKDYEIGPKHLGKVKEALDNGEINIMSQGALTSLLIKEYKNRGPDSSIAESALRKLLDQQISSDTRYRISQVLEK